MSDRHVSKKLWINRKILALFAMMPLLMAADCDSGDSGSASGVIGIILAVVDLVLSIISLT